MSEYEFIDYMGAMKWCKDASVTVYIERHPQHVRCWHATISMAGIWSTKITVFAETRHDAFVEVVKEWREAEALYQYKVLEQKDAKHVQE